MFDSKLYFIDRIELNENRKLNPMEKLRRNKKIVEDIEKGMKLKEYLIREKQIQKTRKTVKVVYEEFCENGRTGRAYTTKLKQDSLWENHLKDRFGKNAVLKGMNLLEAGTTIARNGQIGGHKSGE